MPSRLLEIHQSDDTLIVCLQTLIKTDNRYITLSYCWGNLQGMLILLHGNLAELQRGINITSLPATFRDAVIVTKNLGFQYLWIDALCIIQDPETDKSLELPEMKDIYQNSALTIAVPDGYDSHAGMLLSRDPIIIAQIYS
jgi:hypothetical protein